MYKRRFFIIFPVYSCRISTAMPLGIYAGKNPSGEISPERNKVYSWRDRTHDSFQCPFYLSQMLVSKKFIDGEIVVSVTEVSCLAQFLSGSSCSGNGRNFNRVIQQPVFGQRSYRTLYGCCKTSRVCNALCSCNFIPKCICKAINEPFFSKIGVQPEVVAQIYNPAPFRKFCR